MRQLQRWRMLSTRARTIVFGALAVVAAAVVAVVLLQRDARVALFSQPLRPEQVAEVAQRLAEWNVGFVTVADNVRVDQRRRNELLLRLALAGVPHAHVASSSELLEKVGPLTPSPVLEAEQRSALAGDLELALRGVAGIDDARVIVAPATQAAFADEASYDASAAVRLSLHPGVALAHDVIEGIRTFVAAGVPGLQPKRVTVLDERGLALDGRDGATPEPSPILEASLQSALDVALGAGAAVVRVRVVLDPRIREVHETRREPLAGHAITTTQADERYAGEKKRYTKTHSSEDRGSDVREERTQIPAGATERISAAVLVDATRSPDLAKIRSIAAATIGLNTVRGDTLTVESVRFAQPVAMPRLSTDALVGYVASFTPLLVVAIALLVGLRLTLRPALATLDSLATRAAFRQPVTHLAPGQVHAALSGEPPHTVAAVIAALPTATAAAVLELYPPEERAAIVRRLATPVAPVARGLATLLQRG